MTEPLDAEPGSADSIRFYTRAGCPTSAYVSQRLRRLGFRLECRDIWADPDAAAFVRSVASGCETVPTVVVADTVLVAPSVGRVVATITARAPHLLPDGSAARRLSRVGRLFAWTSARTRRSAS